MRDEVNYLRELAREATDEQLLRELGLLIEELEKRFRRVEAEPLNA
jgi:hypothetical protein